MRSLGTLAGSVARHFTACAVSRRPSSALARGDKGARGADGTAYVIRIVQVKAQLFRRVGCWCAEQSHADGHVAHFSGGQLQHLGALELEARAVIQAQGITLWLLGFVDDLEVVAVLDLPLAVLAEHGA